MSSSNAVSAAKKMDVGHVSYKVTVTVSTRNAIAKGAAFREAS